MFQLFNPNQKLLCAAARPGSVAYRGGIVYIQAHDEWYGKMINAFRRDIMAFHPETASQFNECRAIGAKANNKGKAVGELLRAYKYFKQTEIFWYAAFSLKPPVVKRKIDKKRRLYMGGKNSEGFEQYRHPSSVPKSDGLGIPNVRYSGLNMAGKEAKAKAVASSK